MPFIRKHRLVFAPLFLLVCGTAGLLLLLPSASQEPAEQTELSIADQIRALAADDERPEAAVALAQQYLAAHPETTLERQRVHYELAASQWFSGDEDAALATFGQIVVRYGAADFDKAADDYRVDDALYFIGVLQGSKGNRDATIAALETLVAQFPKSNRRPRAMFDLGNMSIEDGNAERGLAYLSAVVQQHPASEFAPAALRAINAYLLDPANASTDEALAANVAAATVNIETLTAKYAASPDTSQAWQDLLWFYRDKPDQAKPVARRMIELYFQADPEIAGDALCAAAMTLLDHDGDRTVAKAALARFVAQRSGADCPPYARYRLARLLSEDAAESRLVLDEARALDQALATQYAGTEQEAEALRWSVVYLLSREANAPAIVDDAAHAQNVSMAEARIDELFVKFPDAPETVMAHQDLLGHHLDRFDYAAAEPAARRIMERFPGTRAGAEAQMELAEAIVELRRDFAAAHELTDANVLWAMDQGNVELEALFRWSKSRILVIEGRCAESCEVAQEVVELAHPHEEARWLLVHAEAQIAYGYFMDKEYATAVDEFTRVLEQYPEEESWAPFLKFYIGLSHLYAGETDEAREAFVRLVDDHPEDGWAYAAFQYMDLGIEKPANLWQPDGGRAEQ